MDAIKQPFLSKFNRMTAGQSFDETYRTMQEHMNLLLCTPNSDAEQRAVNAYCQNLAEQSQAHEQEQLKEREATAQRESWRVQIESLVKGKTPDQARTAVLKRINALEANVSPPEIAFYYGYLAAYCDHYKEEDDWEVL